MPSLQHNVRKSWCALLANYIATLGHATAQAAKHRKLNPDGLLIQMTNP